MSTDQPLNKAYLLILLSLNFAPVEKVLAGTGLSVDDIRDAGQIYLADVLKMMANLNEYSDTPLWPARFGSHLGVTSHGPVGYATLSAPTLGKAIETFVEWEKVRSNTYYGEVVERPDHMEVLVHDTTGNSDFQAVFFETFIRACEVLTAQIIGHSNVGETEVHFQAVAPQRQALLKREFDSRLCFGCRQNKLLVPKSLWFLRSPLYDRESFEFNLRKCRQLEEELAPNHRADVIVRGKIRHHFDQTIIATELPEPPPEQRQICLDLHMTERTLIRQLKDRGTSYRKILEEERCRYAETLLGDARYTVVGIAEILGYREPANFCRAFKRWYGISPSAYRRR